MDLAGSSTKQKEGSEWTREAITPKKLEWDKKAVTSRKFHSKSGFLLRVTVSKSGEQSPKWDCYGASLQTSQTNSKKTAAWASTDLHEFVYSYVRSINTKADLESIAFRLYCAPKLLDIIVKKNKVILEMASPGDPAVRYQCE